MKQILVLLLIFITTNSFAGFDAASRIEGCNEKQARSLEFAHLIGEKATKALQTQIEKRIESESNLTENEILKLEAVLSTVKCISRKLPKLTYHCREVKEGLCTETNYAWTVPFIGRKVRICPNFWKKSSVFVYASTLVHEASHKCGTHDADYFTGMETPHDVGVLSWAMIADSYGYWALNGFCIPEIDC